MADHRSPNDLTTGLLLFLHFSLISTLSAARFTPPDNHLIACGASSAASLHDGRSFLSDTGRSPPVLHAHGISLSNRSPNTAPLHGAARVFSCPSSYVFDVKNKGTHLIRLHFYPFTTPEYNLSSASFHVLASGIALLSDFGTSSPLLKEYLINLDQGKLVITFAPADRSSFAFVNAIEVVSVPKDLILYPARLVKSDEVTNFDGLSKQALETLYRINVGGPKVTSFNDTLWRTWVPDVEFLKLNSATELVSYSGRIKYQTYGASREVAPDNVYNTARVMKGASVSASNSSMTWEFSVSSGYKYLIRLHFCDIASLALNELYLNVYINGYLAYEDFDVSDSTEQILASPHYVDFVVDVDASEVLSISIGPSKLSRPSWIRGLLNGLEIMKMNNTMGNLVDGFPVILVSEDSLRRGFGTFVRSLACGFASVGLLAIVFMLLLRWRTESRNHMAWSRIPVNDGNLTTESPVIPDSAVKVCFYSSRGKLITYNSGVTRQLTLQLKLSKGTGGMTDEKSESRIYIGNIDQRVTESNVIKMFSPFGKILSEDYLWHTRGPKRGEPRGYAFIQYSSKEEAQLAKAKMNGKFVSGRPLVVRLASEKQSSGVTNESKIASSARKTNTACSTSGQMNRNAKIAAIKHKLKALEEDCGTKKPRLLTDSSNPDVVHSSKECPESG